MSRFERRHAPRRPVCIDCLLDFMGEPRIDAPQASASAVERIPYDTTLAGRSAAGSVLDLSENGAYITAPVVPPVLTRVWLRFSLDLVEVSAIALVAWSRRAPDGARPLGFGVLFEALRLEHRAAIARFVASAEAGSAGGAA